MSNVYTETADYMNFIADMMIEQNQMQDYINDCIRSTSPESLHEEFVINEGKMGDRIKGFFNKIKEFFSKIFQKFSEKMDAVFKNDKEYLEKYKDIIIGKKCTLESVKMKDHNTGMKRIEDVLTKTDQFAVVPSDNFWTELSNITTGKGGNGLANADKFDEDLRKKLLADIGIDSTNNNTGIRVDADTNFSAACTNFFNGSESDMEFTGDSLNMEHIFNAVYAYDKTKASLTKVRNAYMNNLTKIENTYASKLEQAIKDYKAEGKGAEIAQKMSELDAEISKSKAPNATSAEVAGIISNANSKISEIKSTSEYSKMSPEQKSKFDAELKKETDALNTRKQELENKEKQQQQPPPSNP